MFYLQLYLQVSLFIYVFSIISFNKNIAPLQKKYIKKESMEKEKFYLNSFYFSLFIKSFTPILNLFFLIIYCEIYFKKRNAEILALSYMKSQMIFDKKYFSKDILKIDRKISLYKNISLFSGKKVPITV